MLSGGDLGQAIARAQALIVTGEWRELWRTL